MSDNPALSRTTKTGNPLSIAIFYAKTSLGLLLLATAISWFGGELGKVIIAWAALMLAPISLTLILACISEIGFHRMAVSNSVRDRTRRFNNLQLVIWPALGMLFGLLATLPLSISYVPKSDLIRFAWFSYRLSPYAVWIFVAGLVDVLATWYRGSWSEHSCRMRLRWWVVIVFAQQIMLVFMELVRGLAEGFRPWIYWAYVGTIVLLATAVITARLIALILAKPPQARESVV